MSLQAGSYVIKSKSTEGAYIGRHIAEDKSLLPKRILLLPADFTPVPEWEIIKADEGYILRARHSHVTHFDDLLFAILLPEPPATKWKIEAQPQHGKNTYTISEVRGYKGWVSPQETFEQVKVGPLIVMPSDPPRYPPNELFEITAVNM